MTSTNNKWQFTPGEIPIGHKKNIFTTRMTSHWTILSFLVGFSQSVSDKHCQGGWYPFYFSPQQSISLQVDLILNLFYYHRQRFI